MSRNPRFVAPPSPNQAGLALAPTTITKQEFGRRLYKRMREKNWNQSDLARAAFGTGPDGHGRRRDSISSYIRGMSFPDPKSLDQLARALSCEVEELLPNSVISAIDKEEPALEIKQASGHPDKVWLRVNQVVTLDQAVEIASILKRSPAAAVA